MADTMSIMSRIEEYMLSKPRSNFVVFTHQDGGRFSADYLIRKFITQIPKYRKRNLNIDRTFSHTGSVWVEDGKLVYYHQTYPRFKKEDWSFRHFNVIFEVDNEEHVNYARWKCRDLYKKRNRYSIFGLFAFAFTIWFPWLRNPIKAGKVCSGAVAASYPNIVTGKPYHDVDPQYAHDKFLEKLKDYTVLVKY